MRYWVSGLVYAQFGRQFPYGTLAVNVIGSLLMGFLYISLVERMAVASEWRSFLLIGVLGAFTTFSTFSIETLNLIEQAEYLRAGTNVAVSVFACVGAAMIGVMLARQL